MDKEIEPSGEKYKKKRETALEQERRLRERKSKEHRCLGGLTKRWQGDQPKKKTSRLLQHLQRNSGVVQNKHSEGKFPRRARTQGGKKGAQRPKSRGIRKRCRNQPGVKRRGWEWRNCGGEPRGSPSSRTQFPDGVRPAWEQCPGRGQSKKTMFAGGGRLHRQESDEK